MRPLSDTVARLTKPAGRLPESTPGKDRLATLATFGSNPGELNARFYVPQSLEGPPALVVVLHGCTQTAAGYDYGSGWSALADDDGFLLLFPEQRRANNPNLCFNWFLPGDTKRGQGEVMSIRQMIAAMAQRFDVDEARIFITGLSAGAAMANAMLATYPEVFAGGAVIAGLPYGTASSVPEAFDRMRGQGLPKTPALQASLKAASSHGGPWPTLSIWHGTGDNTVTDTNAHALVEQWRSAHGLQTAPSLTENLGSHTRKVWQDAEGRSRIEFFSIHGMAHGTPLDVKSGIGKTALTCWMSASPQPATSPKPGD